MPSPDNCRYTREHEWARVEADGTVTVGITDHAQDALGDVVFVELPRIGDQVEGQEKFGVVESVKTVSDLYSPCSGEVVAINDELESQPELVNSDALGGGWIVRLEPSDINELDKLMDAETYDAFVAEEAG